MPGSSHAQNHPWDGTNMAEVTQSLLNPELRMPVLIFTSPTQSVGDTLRVYQNHLMRASLWKDILVQTFLSMPCDFSIVFLSKLCSFFLQLSQGVSTNQTCPGVPSPGYDRDEHHYNIAWEKWTRIKWQCGGGSKLTCELMFIQVKDLFQVSWQTIWQIHIYSVSTALLEVAV